MVDLPTIQEINALGTWTEGSRQELETLQKTVGNDPKVLSDRCRRVRGVLFRLGIHIQKMRITAMQMALKKVCAHRSYLVAMRRQSLSQPNMRSMRLRRL